MRIQAIGLSIRLARFELLTFVGLIVGLVVALGLSVVWLEGIRPDRACFEPRELEVPGCGHELNAWYSAQAATTGLFRGLLIGVSFAAGLFLGAPLVARELERGTTRLAWSLAPSRFRWYLGRLVPLLAAVAVLTYGAGIALDRLAAWTYGGLDVANAFEEFGLRGLLIASRATFIFGVGVAAGTIVGRSLPAVILSAVVAIVGLSGGEAVHQRMLRDEAVAVEMDAGGPGDMFVDQRFRLPDGSLVGYQHFDGREPFDAEGNPLYPMVAIVVPGERYRFVETREAVVLAGGTLFSLLLAGAVVTRRRPD